KIELDHRPLSRRYDLAGLLWRHHRQFGIRHALHGAGFSAGEETACRRDSGTRGGVRARNVAAHSRQSDAEHPDADLPLRGDQAVAGWAADPLIRLADRLVPT